MPSYAFASLHYSMFNPRLVSPSYPYFLRQMDFDYCIGISNNTIPLAKNPLDFPVDLTVLSGFAFISNNESTVKFGTDTKFGYAGVAGEIIAQQNFDFDGDGRADQSLLGRLETDPVTNIERFVAGGEEVQGVYLSSTSNSPNNPDPVLAQPNLTRVIDHEQDVELNIELLSISHEDMKNTDIIVARESNGKIIAERRGIDFNEAHLAEVGVDDDVEGLFYTVKLRGPRETFYHVPPWAVGVANMMLPNTSPCELPEFQDANEEPLLFGYHVSFAKMQQSDPCSSEMAGKNNSSVTDDALKTKEITDWAEYAKVPYAKWQADDDIVEEFRARDSDLPRAGEKVRVIAINRATGYMGTITTELTAAGSTTSGEVDWLFSQSETNRPTEVSFNPIQRNKPQSLVSASINSAATPIIMRPPNLKVWAKRTTKIEHGTTQGQSKEYFVGDEGIAKNLDEHIDIYTEWLDHDGQALPEALADYGFTGRLAKLVGKKTLVPASGGVKAGEQVNTELAQFSIAPGTHVQSINLSDESINKSHFYLQVNPSPMNRKPDFSGKEKHAGLLNDRPNKLVPVQVAVYDEDATLIQKMAYNLVNTNGSNPPEPIYRWISRPEYTFSIFDLKVTDIMRKVNPQTAESSIIDLTNPEITFMDEFIKIAYSLEMTLNEPINRFMGVQELIFALGAQELTATLGLDKEVIFTQANLNHLKDLNPDDFTTIRLYANNDPENNLWEYDFKSKIQVLYKLPDEETLIESEKIEGSDVYHLLGGVRLKYKYPLPEGAVPEKFTWTFSGSGRFCNDWGVDAEGCETKETREGAQYAEVFWEPKEWANDVDSTVTLTGSYRLNGKSVDVDEEFKVVSRNLVPIELTPMKGSDVQMLEEMLWHIGMGPNGSKRGYLAVR